MTARYATADEIKKWDTLITANPDGGSIFSSYEYAQQKRMNGYTPHFVIVGDIAVTVLEKTTFPLGRLWYLPKGPNVLTGKLLLEVLAALRPLAKKRRVFVIRSEPEIARSQKASLIKKGLVSAAPIIPNPSTITLDICASLDEVLLALPQAGRHAIRRAERDGVTVTAVKATDKNCRIMYSLLKETAEGQFGIRSYKYFRTFWKRFDSAGLGQLFFASFEGAIVAGAFAMTLGEKSTYKDGASVRKRTAYGASHLLQWKVIEWAKSQGASLHDFCGSPPSDEIHNTEHPHYGVGRFKLAFSKNVVDYVGCLDFVISPKLYAAWLKVGERVHRGLYRRLAKDYYY